ncbi:ctc-interacting domain-containing protein [Pycnococcus provasolii]|uniref:Ctc-interacting domain-containing protein n=1 Tax=Pycnococcus provasolii TaxID=41880 RepID=A0A830H963_9CHLO|nr:ctc-interacting domain-containing protein [Pycnococcus provasolii]
MAPSSLPHTSTQTTNSESSMLAFLCHALVGRNVRVTTKDNNVYEGILANTAYDENTNLRMASLVVDGKTRAPPTKRQKPKDSLTISKDDFAAMEAVDVPILEDAFGSANMSFGRGGAKASADNLDTDGGISGGSRGAGRTLQKWVADDNATKKTGGLDTFGGSSAKTWDQFEANERLYGVKGGFDESLYTTSLDKKSSKISEAEAARIAAEIEKGGGAGGKVPTRDIDDLGEDDVDEEDKFSSVLADGRATKQNFDERNDETFGAAPAATATKEKEKEAAPSPASTAEAAAASPPAAKSSLNANAKPFTLSATAKPFVPPSAAAVSPVSPPMPNPYAAPNPYATMPGMMMPGMPGTPPGMMPGMMMPNGMPYGMPGYVPPPPPRRYG